MTAAIDLIRDNLEAAYQEIATDAGGRLQDSVWLYMLGNAARVLGQHSIADRVARLLQSARNSPTNEVSVWPRTLDPPEELEARHPRIGPDRLVERIRSYADSEKHFALCLQGRYADARALAGSGVRLEEVGQALAVLGEFDLALEVARDPSLEPPRQRGVRFIALIELLRRGRDGEADVLLAELQRAGIGVAERIHLALGVGGRDPWNCYPFPDW